MTLGGTAEVANLLGCRKTQVYALRQKPNFPKPIAMLAATPVWDLGDFETFVTSRRKVLTGVTGTD